MPLRVPLAAALLLLAVAAAPAEARRLGDRPLARGSTGSDVRTLQRALTALEFRADPADGIYGARTLRAVKRWERARRRPSDGRVSRGEGRRIRREFVADRSRPADPTSSLAVGPGATGEHVAQVQRDLAALGFDVVADGVYGDGTAAAIGEYQRLFLARSTGALGASGVARHRRRVESVPPGEHVFPIAGEWSPSGSSGRYGDPRGTHIHAGQDLAADAGTPLVAVTAGTVSVRAYQASGAGNYVVLRGDDGRDYVYMHLRRPAVVKPGTRVAAGQRLGEVGSTGRSTGPHLHFEMWTAHWYDGGRSMDPLPALLAWR
jgi:murein DD-endopeptidase MepM/ murein hydrolase activator NlpD